LQKLYEIFGNYLHLIIVVSKNSIKTPPPPPLPL
jgi:hypothetical protein